MIDGPCESWFPGICETYFFPWFESKGPAILVWLGKNRASAQTFVARASKIDRKPQSLCFRPAHPIWSRSPTAFAIDNTIRI
jgi:hypothetical protein